MNPVKGYTMINFLHWVAIRHPEVKQLKTLPEDELLQLVDEFEGGKLRENETLKKKWLMGFREFLFKGQSDWEGYDVARGELESLESGRH